MCDGLKEIELSVSATAMSSRMSRFVGEAMLRSKEIKCFDFVPSNADALHATLSAMARGRFCEWGSGMGIGVGIAEMLGFRAVGIEIDERLADASRELLKDFGLRSDIVTASYFDVSCEAEIFFVYAWPSETRLIRPHFASLGLSRAKLLICNGAADIRCAVLGD